MGKLITRKGAVYTALITVFAIVGMFVTISVFGLTAWGEEKEKGSENTAQIRVIQAELNIIKTTVKKISDNQELLLRDQIKPEDLFRLIKKAVKEGSDG